MNIDLSALTLQQFAILLLAVAAVDFATGVYSALHSGSFSWAAVADVLETHVLKRVIPILAPVALSLSLPAGQTHDVLWSTALAATALYLTETISSITDNLKTPAKS